MLTVAEETLLQLAKDHDKQVATHLYGQEIYGETFAICKVDLLLNTKAVIEALDAARASRPRIPPYCAVVFLTAEIQQLASNTILPVDGGSANLPPEVGTGWKSGLRFSNFRIADNPSDKGPHISATLANVGANRLFLTIG